MSDLIRWAIAIEVVGGAFLPLALWVFRALPDRGYIFAKMLGLVCITYVTWLVGSFLPIASSVALPLTVLLVGGALSWWFLWEETVRTLGSLRNVIAIEEGLFLLALIVWSVLRAQVFHPGIGHTEQYMDMSLLGASIHSGSYPPYDPWMSGHTVNYYYVGYLMFGLLVKLSGVAPTVGYNLSLSVLFAFVIAGTWSLAYALTRRFTWALLAPVFVGLLGNWHAVLVQLFQAHQDPSTTYYWFWGSTRVIGSNTTITEFPFFSFMLGDLHPHVMSFPLVLLALAFGVSIVQSAGPVRLERSVGSLAPFGLLAVTVGMLFTVNSWDFPTYLLLVSGCLAANAYLRDDSRTWWQAPLGSVVALGIISLLLYTPFYVQFRSPTHGLGPVTTPSDLFEFLQVMGVMLLPAALLLGSLAFLFQPSGAMDAEHERIAAAKGRATEVGTLQATSALRIGAYGVLFVAVLIESHAHAWVFLLMLTLGLGAAWVLYRVINSEGPHAADIVALAFMLVALLMLAVPEIVYVRDSFDNGPSYRMNTLFKLYYQAWTLLGVVSAYGAYRGWGILRRHLPTSYGVAALALIAAGVVGGLYYTVNAPQSANQGGVATSLDGSSLLAVNAPGDYAAVQWLRKHSSGNPIEMEGTGGEYDAKFARISTFTGLPTVMGWAGHEFQWRGSDPDIQRRVDDIKTVYTTSDVGRARSLLRQYSVRYVIVGSTEHQAYTGADLAKFSRFMRTAFSSGGTTIYTW